MEQVVWLAEVGNDDVGRVGGKNASLGEMIQKLRRAGIRVPEGFATTADAYRALLAENGLVEPITRTLGELDGGKLSLHEAGTRIRQWIGDAHLPPDLEQAIRHAYRSLAQRAGVDAPDVAVRSSATAEDLPTASFAGQQESFLNIRGEDALLRACLQCFASLFTDRAISYRIENGFDHMKVALSIGVQRMVRSDLAGAGVIFTIHTDTGFPRAVMIDAVWGLGETLVKGISDPDEFVVFKPLLERRSLRPIIERRLGGKRRKLVYADAGNGEPTRMVETSEEDQARFVLDDTEVLQLARWAVEIERHYGRPMDIEWAKDGRSGELFIVQARPETVHGRRTSAAFQSWHVRKAGPRLLEGLSVGASVATGRVFKLASAAEDARFEDGGILVAERTDPDWVPIMRRARAIITDHGGRTSHAAIVSRELGVPAVVGTHDATRLLQDGQEVTVSCAEGDRGVVFEGKAEVDVEEISPEDLPYTRTRVMLNLADPSASLRWWRLPTDGIGLARMEFIVGQLMQVHPMALVHFDQVQDPEDRARIEALTKGYPDRREYFVDQLSLGVAQLAAGQYPNPVILRTSDFKTNEYARLVGGSAFEPAEENPMIGWRGASRYYHAGYRDGFALECRAIRRVREEMGFENVVVMIPFCRTVEEADRVLEVMAQNGLVRGERGLKVYMMCEIPSNVILADRFAEKFDGFSIGSNDLTQLVLGIDRDSERLSAIFNERDEAVTMMITQEIQTAHASRTPVGFCGQAPSNDPSFARLLVQAGIDSISVTPDSFVAVKRNVAEVEETMRHRHPELAEFVEGWII